MGEQVFSRDLGKRERPPTVDFNKLDDYSRFEAAKSGNERVENLAPKSESEYKGSDVFLSVDNDVGYIVKGGDLQNVFNNSNVRGAGSAGIFKAIEESGAVTLDCYDGRLPVLYTQFGFVEVARIKFADEYAPPGWDYDELGRPDVVVMAYKGGDVSRIRERFGKFIHRITDNYVDDFDAAQATARKSVKLDGDPLLADVVRYGDEFFSDEALLAARKETDFDKYSSAEKSRKVLVYLTPQEFLNMAEPFPMGKASRKKLSGIERLLAGEVKFNEIPALYLEKDGSVWGHNGRHRAVRLKSLGVERMPVLVEAEFTRWAKQTDPKNREYKASLVSQLTGQDGTSTMRAPWHLEGPNRGRPLPDFDTDRPVVRPPVEDAAQALARDSVDVGEGAAKTDPPTRYQRRDGRALGYFEWDAAAAKYVIALFRDGDMNTLWHEQGHLVSAIMGDKWMDKMVRYFDHEVAPNGNYRLTNLGEEQLADAWMHYMQTKHTPHGPAGRLFDQLLWSLKEIWRRLRGKDADVPLEMRRAWDAWLEPEQQSARYAAMTQDNVMKARHPTIVLKATRAERLEAELPKKVGKARDAVRVDLRPESVRQALGLKDELYYKDISTDPNVPEHRIGRRATTVEVDAVQLVNDALAYVLTEQWKKGIIAEDWVRITMRTMVPKSRMDRMERSIKNRLSDAIGVHPKNLKILDAGATVSPDTPGIAVGTLAGRTYNFDRSVMILDPAQAAGLKTLVHELASEPMGNIIPDEMLDPNANFNIVTVEQYDAVMETMIDVEAGVSARATRYAEKISPTLGYAMVDAVKAMARGLAKPIDSVSEIRSKLTSKFVVPKFGDDLIDPVPKDIIEGTKRELNTLDRWLLRLADKAIKEDGATVWREVYTSMVGRLVAPVDSGQVSTLFDLVDRFGGVLKAEVRRLGRLERGEIASGDEVIQMTRMEINSRLDTIQSILQNAHGLTDTERGALRILRTYEHVSASDLTDADLYAIGDGIKTIHHGLFRRKQLVIERSGEIMRSLDGVDDKTVLKEITDKEYKIVYQHFFNGEFDRLFEWASNKGRDIGADPDVIPEYDQSLAVLEMIARMRANEIVSNMTRKMADYGVTLDTAKLTEHRKFGPNTSLDREKFVDDVLFYINKEMDWDANILRYEGSDRVTPAKAPPKYTIHDLPQADGPGRVGIGNHDMMAYTKAHEVLASWGFKFGKNTWERYVLPDGTEALMPKGAIKELEDAVSRAADIGHAWAGGGGRALRSARGNVALESPSKRSKKVRAQLQLGRAFDTIVELNPITAARIKMGITTGLVLPNPAYYAGVSLGALFQAYQTQGFFAAGKYLAKAPISALRTLGRRPDMVGAVTARMWKEGNYTPHAPAIVTRFGQVYTDEMVSHLTIREGLKSGFIQVETTQAIARDIENKMPEFMGWMKKTPRWWQQNLIEVSTAIDNYFRVSIFVDELAMGKSPSAAAEIARRAGFDYADLTDFEKGTMRRVIMFYSYQRKNIDLFWDTFLRNPQRLIAQMRLIRGSQRLVLDDDEPDVILPEHLQTRLFAAGVADTHNSHVNKGYGFVLPMLPIEDAVRFFSEIYDVAAYAGSERGDEAVRGLVSRATPWVQFPFVTATEKDIYYGYDLNRRNVVPTWLIELDFNMTGGQLYKFLDIGWVETKNKAYEDVPGRGQWIARSGWRWWVWRNLAQFPGAGRSMDTITAADRANLGPVELVVELSALYREHARHPMEEAGWLDTPVTKKGVPYRADEDDWRGETMLPRPGLYDEDSTDFAILEFYGLMGARAKPIKHRNVREAKLIKDHRYVLQRALRDLERK